jgi:hypothetical protein
MSENLGVKSESVWWWLVAGAVGGAAGSLAMDAMRFVGEETGLIHKSTLPHQLEKELEVRAGFAEQTNPKLEMILTQAMHISIGAAYGAAYSLLADTADQSHGLPVGLLYGLDVYGLDLLLVGPALSLTSGPWNQPPLRAGRRLASHLLFGVVTTEVTRMVHDRLQRRQ